MRDAVRRRPGESFHRFALNSLSESFKPKAQREEEVERKMREHPIGKRAVFKDRVFRFATFGSRAIASRVFGDQNSCR